MQSANTLHLIASYLPYQDLLSLSQVNSLANSIASRSDLWKQECYRLFFNSLDLFHIPFSSSSSLAIKPLSSEISWKDMLKQYLAASRRILSLSGTYFTENQTAELEKAILSVMIDPVIPMPCLRREGKTYPTILQDYLAMKNSPEVLIPVISSSSTDLIAEMMNMLDSCGDELYREFSDSNSKNLLAMARWNLKRFLCADIEEGFLNSSRNSIQSTAESFENSMELDTNYSLLNTPDAKPFLIRVFRAMKKMMGWYCKFSLAVISQSTDSDTLISEYTKRWKAFSASITELDKSFHSFNLLLNDIHDSIWTDLPSGPEFSLMRTMIIQWRRKVFTPLKDLLLQSIENLLQRQRKQSGRNSKDEFYLLSSGILSLVDLSVNEQNVHFTDHTKFYSDGVYSQLHDRVLLWTEQFYTYNMQNLPLGEKLEMLKRDLNLIEKLFLPVTASEVKKVNLKLRKNALWGYLEEGFRNFQPRNSYILPVRKETLDMISTSELGRRLFLLFPSEKTNQRIAQYTQHLANCHGIHIMTEFVSVHDELEGMNEMCCEDLEVEIRAEALGYEQELSIIDRFLYSLTTDLTLNQFLCIIDRNL
jgi:hypothetical protein